MSVTFNEPEIYMPTREEIEALKVGDVAPYVLGRGEVVEITHRGEDINGRLFVCFYVRTGPTSQMSASLKEGEIVRSLAVCNRYTSAEIDALDRRMRAERGDTKKSFRD